MKNTLVVISGPTASGKSTVETELLARHPDWVIVQSFTTRPPRANEVVRSKYQHVSRPDFMRQVESQDIIEYEEYAGNLYGTSRISLEQALANNEVVILDVQTKGKEYLKQHYKEAIDIYLYVPNEEIDRRLQQDASRSDIGPEQQRARLKQAVQQNAQRDRYSYVIENIDGQLHSVVKQVESIILSQMAANQS